VHQGVTNTHILTILEGVGFLLFPTVVWTLAVVHARDSRVRFSLVTISCGLCFATMIFFSASELTLALPLVVFASLLLTQRTPWSGSDAAFVIVSTGLLCFSHEAVVPCAVVLAVMALVRIRTNLGRLDITVSVVVLGLSLAVLGSEVWTLVFWPNPNSNSFINLPPSALFLFMGGFCLAGWAVLYRRSFGLAKLRWVLLVVVVPLTVSGIALAIRDGPLAAYFTRGPCLVLVAGVQLLLLVDWIIRLWEPASKSWSVRLSSGAARGAAVVPGGPPDRPDRVCPAVVDRRR
jgi:hypothetical protein